MSISTRDQIHRFGCSLKRAMEFDLDTITQLLGNNQMLSINPRIRIPLPELKRVPLVGLLETRKTYSRAAIQLRFVPVVQEKLKGFCQAIRYRLNGTCRSVCTRCTSKRLVEIVLIWERVRLFVLCLRIFQHGVVGLTCFKEAVVQPILLVFGWIQSIFKRSHDVR